MEVVAEYQGGMKFNACCGNHAVTIDLPLGLGGTDTGPTPPDIFLASLASCVGMYVAGYCKNHHVDASGMKIAVRAEKVQNPGRLDQITVDIRLPDAVVVEKKDAILAVARKCLIHATLAHQPTVTISVAGL